MKILILILFSISCFGFRASVLAQSALININTADSAELETLNGIGPAKAAAIIEYRNGPNGPFETIEEIKNVSGIGEVTYANIKDYITVDTAPAPAENTDAPTESSSGSSVSYSSTPVSNADKRVDAYVSAGKDRLGTAGSPMEFMAETDFDYTKSSIFKWNFGDGSEGNGAVLNHTYEYAGEYAVVLNVSVPQGQTVSRVNVKIIDPEIAVTAATLERIELKNSSKQEVNLYGRTLYSGGKIFIFPHDTIIKAGQSISFSSKVTGLRPSRANDASIIVVGDTEQNKLIAKVEEQRSKEIISLENQLGVLEEKLASISNSTLPSVAKEIQTPVVKVESELSQEVETQTATAVKSGWFAALKRFFLRTR